MTVVITVPHSAPAPESDGHPTDTLARMAAILIFDKLDPPKRIFINSLIPRNLCDLNRPPGDCGFVPQLEVYLQKGKVRLLLDVHSYPSSYEWGKYDVVFLDSNSNSFGLSNLMTSRGVTNTVLRASMCNRDRKCNYIISLAKFEHNIPAFIIEFNEDLNQERLQFITSLIAKWTVSE